MTNPPKNSLPSDPNPLAQWRAEIDVLDAQLLEVLSRRVQVVVEIGKYKQQNGLQPLDPVRWQQVLNANIERGKALNLSQPVIEALYHLIHDYSLELERQEH
ncbi:MAG: chorismate mutase [Vampirovibrionales bacterium]|nr:chorismate mutase [Vampirovibrionales bacterium]